MNNSQSDTDQLLARAREGDSHAVGLLMDRHRRRLTRMVSARMDSHLRARVDPSDVIQETLAKAASKMPHYLQSAPIAFYPWLRQIAWQELLRLQDRHLRSAKRSVSRERIARLGLSDDSSMLLAERLAGLSASPSAQAMEHELHLRLQDAMKKLSEQQRELIIMRYVEQLSAQDIAAVIGISEAAVNMRHMRAVEKLRALLGDRR